MVCCPLVPSHILNQRWFLSNWPLGTNISANLIKNESIFNLQKCIKNYSLPNGGHLNWASVCEGTGQLLCNCMAVHFDDVHPSDMRHLTHLIVIRNRSWLCFVKVLLTYILQGYFTGMHWDNQMLSQWHSHNGMVKISLYQTNTKDNQMWIVECSARLPMVDNCSHPTV